MCIVFEIYMKHFSDATIFSLLLSDKCARFCKQSKNCAGVHEFRIKARLGKYDMCN